MYSVIGDESSNVDESAVFDEDIGSLFDKDGNFVGSNTCRIREAAVSDHFLNIRVGIVCAVADFNRCGIPPSGEAFSVTDNLLIAGNYSVRWCRDRC